MDKLKLSNSAHDRLDKKYTDLCYKTKDKKLREKYRVLLNYHSNVRRAQERKKRVLTDKEKKFYWKFTLWEILGIEK